MSQSLSLGHFLSISNRELLKLTLDSNGGDFNARFQRQFQTVRGGRAYVATLRVNAISYICAVLPGTHLVLENHA